MRSWIPETALPLSRRRLRARASIPCIATGDASRMVDVLMLVGHAWEEFLAIACDSSEVSFHM